MTKLKMDVIKLSCVDTKYILIMKVCEYMHVFSLSHYPSDV